MGVANAHSSKIKETTCSSFVLNYNHFETLELFVSCTKICNSFLFCAVVKLFCVDFEERGPIAGRKMETQTNKIGSKAQVGQIYPMKIEFIIQFRSSEFL